MSVELKEFTHNSNRYGHYFESSDFYVFFGQKLFTEETFNIFPNFKFHNLKQTHGDIIFETNKDSPENREGDAHWTHQTDLALLVQTADCIPLLIFERSSKKVAAIHAGWRGVEKKIIPKTLLLLAKNIKNPFFDIFLGPCIHQSSFEVDEDVCKQLVKSTFSPNAFFSYSKEKSKYYIDLIGITQKQIFETQFPHTFYNIDKNTFTEQNYSSFRREKSPCRNWSFILKKSL